MNGQYSVQLNPLILTSQKEISMCLLMSYNKKYTILPIKSCQKLESEFDQASTSTSLQRIQGQLGKFEHSLDIMKKQVLFYFVLGVIMILFKEKESLSFKGVSKLWPVDHVLLYSMQTKNFSFTFLSSWGAKKIKRYLLRCENDITTKFQCPQIKIY